MSVQCNTYVGFGYMLNYKIAQEFLKNKWGEDGREELMDKYHDNAFKSEIVEINGFSLIVDGMNGDYTFFGKLFAKSKTYEQLETMEVPKISAKLKKALDEEMLNIFGIDVGVAPKMMIIVHYR